MSEIVRIQTGQTLTTGIIPRVPGVTIRAARQDDFPAIDALHKEHDEQLGFTPDVAFRRRIDSGELIVAEAGSERALARYLMGVDRYMKQDHVGIVYHLCVAREHRRQLVAASLLRAQFDRSAYGTRLYGCWCKQSIAANRFWEGMGFVPLAFRAGGRSKRKGEGEKVHIYWQKRIRPGDTETAYWYPFKTEGGQMMEQRVVLPIPPGVRWSDAVPVVLPGSTADQPELKLLVDEVERADDAVKRARRKGKRGGAKRAERDAAPPKEVVRVVSAGGFGFGASPGFDPEAAQTAESPEVVDEQNAEAEAAQAARAEALLAAEAAKAEATAKLKAAQKKHDPALLAYARELRDKWQEHVATDAGRAMLEGRTAGKHDVLRLPGPEASGSSLRPNRHLLDGETSRSDPRLAA